jgi:hypothetical protein
MSALDELREQLPEQLHEAYERLAPSFGYTTRAESAVPWGMVPENNRALMRAAVGEAIDTFAAAHPGLVDLKQCPVCGGEVVLGSICSQPWLHNPELRKP